MRALYRMSLVHNLLNQDENEWRTDEGAVQDQGFVLRIRGCERNITGLRIRNAVWPWASKRFKVAAALKFTGPWINLVEAELKKTDSVITFHFSQPLETKFLRFDLLSFFSQRGGGLNFFSLIAECEALPQPEVVYSTSYITSMGVTVDEHRIEGIFTDGGYTWLTKDKFTGHGFTIKPSACVTNIVGVRVKNNPGPERATRSFRVLVLRESGPWEQMLEAELENPLPAEAPEPTLQTILFREAVEVQFLRFDLVSYWGSFGGGLDYFEVVTVSDLCQSIEMDNCPPYDCGTPAPTIENHAGVNCQCSHNCTEPVVGGGLGETATIAITATFSVLLLALLICLFLFCCRRWILSRTFKDDINTAYGIYPENEDTVEMKAVDQNAENDQKVAGGEETSSRQVSGYQENEYDKMYSDENQENNYDNMYTAK